MTKLRASLAALAALTLSGSVGWRPAVAQGAGTPADPPSICSSEGNLKLLCGIEKAEDLQRVPGTNWVVTSSLAGGIFALHTRDKRPVKLFPADTARTRYDRRTYNDCPGPPDAAEQAKFTTLGINVGRAKRGVHTLYVDRYPGDSVTHVFELDLRGAAPFVTWVGCVPSPGTMLADAVVALRNGGFIASKFYETGVEQQASRARALAGQDTGGLWEWHPSTGWKELPGTNSAGANGIEISADEKTLFVNQWGSRSFLRVTRGVRTPKRDVVKLDFRPDNVHWAPDGQLLIAGHNDTESRMIKIHPKTLKVTPLWQKDDTPVFFHATGAAQIGSDYWIGTSRAAYIGILPAAETKSAVSAR